MLDNLLAQLNNQFVGGGLILMLTGSIIALLRSMPGKAWRWVTRRVTVEVEVLNSDPLFDYVTAWLDKQPYSRRSRKLTATTKTRMKQDDDDEPAAARTPRVFLSPAPGMHVFWYAGRLIRLERNRDNGPGASTGMRGLVSPLKHESYKITLLGKNQSALRALITEIVDSGSSPSDSIRLFSSSFGYWRSRGVMTPRKLESVVLPTGVAESVLADAKQFLESADWYTAVGIPWHRGYLLFGLPGTGKSSLVTAVAGELGMDLYLLNIGGSGMNDDRLSSLMADIRPGTIVLMEDVDCVAPNRDSEKDGERVTLSGLLNCLDGVQSSEGCMIFMTTNSRETLDPALTRPGRVDLAIEFGIATDDQILRLLARLAPDRAEDEILAECKGKTMAEAQQILLSTR